MKTVTSASVSLQGHYVEFTDVRASTGPCRSGTCWPSELDLMARLAGMRLRDRWEDWDRKPFTGESSQHVSVWEKPAR